MFSFDSQNNLNMPTSIFSSSFFWSMSVIRRWMTEGDGRGLGEPASSFLMHDWKSRQSHHMQGFQTINSLV